MPARLVTTRMVWHSLRSGRRRLADLHPMDVHEVRAQELLLLRAVLPARLRTVLVLAAMVTRSRTVVLHPEPARLARALPARGPEAAEARAIGAR